MKQKTCKSCKAEFEPSRPLQVVCSLECAKCNVLFIIYGGGGGFCRVDRMAAWLIAVIGVVYLVVAVQLLLQGKIGLGIAFVGYALGNVGLYIAAR